MATDPLSNWPPRSRVAEIRRRADGLQDAAIRDTWHALADRIEAATPELTLGGELTPESHKAIYRDLYKRKLIRR